MNRAKRDFLGLEHYPTGQLARLVERTVTLKRSVSLGGNLPLLGKSVGLLFEKPSTRTRVSFEVAIYQLGGQAIFLSPRDVQISRGETVGDTARTLSRYLSALVVRTFAQSTLEELAAAATIPIINALSDDTHPCQVLADLVTMRESRGSLAGTRLTYLGDGNNMANSLIFGCAHSGVRLTLSCAPGYRPRPELVARGQALAKENGGSVEMVEDPRRASAGAEFLYTDVWTSMGQEAEAEKRRRDLAPWQLNQELLALAAPGARVLHCLPAHRGEEITAEVMDGPASIVFDQAENRLHAQKALLEWVFEG